MKTHKRQATFKFIEKVRNCSAVWRPFIIILIDIELDWYMMNTVSLSVMNFMHFY